MLELPISEDIYDFDTFTLREHYEKITNEFNVLVQEENKSKELTTWLKKARKLIDMISLEIEERQAVEDFGSFCERGAQYLATLDNFNPYANERKPQDKHKIENLLPKTIGNVIVELPESEASTGLEDDTSQSQSSKNTVHFEDHKSETSEPKSHNEDMDKSSVSAMRIYESMHHGMKKKGPNKANTKKNALFEFMKETLANTRVVENTFAVGQSAVGQKKVTHLSSPDAMKKKEAASHSMISDEGKKKPNKAVPLRKPDPGFSTRETKTQNFMDLGGGIVNKPAISNMKKTSSGKKRDIDSASSTGKIKKELPLIRKESLIQSEKKPERKQSAESSISSKSNKLPAIAQAQGISKSEEKKLTVSQSKAEIKPTEPNIIEEIERDTEEDPNQNIEKDSKGTSDREIEEKIDSGSDEEIEEDEEEEAQTLQKTTTTKRAKGGADDITPFDNIEESTEDLTAFKRSKAVTKKMNSQPVDPTKSKKGEKNSSGPSSSISTASQSKTPSGSSQSNIKETPQSLSQKTAENEKSEANALKRADSTKDAQVLQGSTSQVQPTQNNRGILSEKTDHIMQNDNKSQDALITKTHTNFAPAETSINKESSVEAETSTHSSLKSGSSQSMRPLSNQPQKSNNSNPINPTFLPSENPRKASVDYLDDSDYSDLDDESEKLEVKSLHNEEHLQASSSKIIPTSKPVSTSGLGNSNLEVITIDHSHDEDAKSQTSTPDPIMSDVKSPSHQAHHKQFSADLSASGNFTSPKSSQEAGKEEPVIKRVPSNLNTVARIEPLRNQPAISQPATNYKEELKQKLEEAQEKKKALDIFEQDKKIEKLKASNSKMNLALSASKSQLPVMEPSEDPKSKDSIPEPSEAKSTIPSAIQAKKAKVPGTNKKNDFINIPDDEIVDYSAHFDSFQKIFSGAIIDPSHFDYLNTMRELLHMFGAHVSKVDNTDNILSKYKPSLAPLEFGPNDLLALNNPNQIYMYANKTNIDLRKFIERQQVFNQNVRVIQNNDEDDGPQTNDNKETLYYRVVKTKQEVYDIITRSFLRKKNWVELPHGMNLKTTWNLMWTWSKPEIDMSKLLYWQKVNHFPGNKAIVRKDLLKANIEKMQRLGTKASAIFNIIPLTFFLPKEMTKFMETFYANIEKAGVLNIWIMKPIGKSRGRGISLINDIGQIKYTEPVVVQEYLKNPLLLDGYKFDMRIYVLVTSLNPLEVFLYKEGFARLSTAQFTLDEDDLKNLYIHLTNTSVQKYSNNADNMTSDAIIGGTKISLKTLKTRLEYRGIRWQSIWDQVGEIIVKSLVAVQNEIPQNPNCFELFGYDIIIDKNLKCWLLEVNSSPSLERMNILDDLVKQQLIDDIVDLTSPIQFDRRKLVQVLERRVLEEQRCKSTINTSNNSKHQMNKDLTYILGGKKIRDLGTLPENMGNFERIAPTEMSDKIIKLVQSYKAPMRVPTQQEKRTTQLN